jgi:hypothetical protein
MNTEQLTQAIENQYDNGRYLPCGSDGGALSYIIVKIDDKEYHASITGYSEIAKIRRIWDLSDNDNTIYDFTKEYYKVSGN